MSSIASFRLCGTGLAILHNPPLRTLVGNCDAIYLTRTRLPLYEHILLGQTGIQVRPESQLDCVALLLVATSRCIVCASNRQRQAHARPQQEQQDNQPVFPEIFHLTTVSYDDKTALDFVENLLADVTAADDNRDLAASNSVFVF